MRFLKSKLNSRGFSHHLILPLIIVAIIALIGVRVIMESHADAVTQASATSQAAISQTQSAAAPLAVKVSGNKLVNQNGKTIILRGVNYSGNEYSCDKGYGIFQGPATSDFVISMEDWHVQAVRLSLNEDCWLGINDTGSGDPNPNYEGTKYQQAIINFVNLLKGQGIYTILDLHNSAPGSWQSDTQFPMPDKSNSIAFWTSVAKTFKSNQSVIFEPFNEPFVGNYNVTINPVNGVTPSDWQCWLSGCSLNYANPYPGVSNITYAAAGMQQLVKTIRVTAGAKNVIMLSGLNYANDISSWLAYEPTDTLHNLVASAHVYGLDTCENVHCLTLYDAPIAKKVPVIFGEVGNTYNDSACGDSNIRSIMTWADKYKIGYLAWAYDNWGTCSGLINSWNGGSGSINTANPPGQAYATYVYDHLRSFPVSYP